VLSFAELAKAETQVKSLNAENMDGITLGRISKPGAQHEYQVFLILCVFCENCGNQLCLFDEDGIPTYCIVVRFSQN
jgi:hypothetical protein